MPKMEPRAFIDMLGKVKTGRYSMDTGELEAIVSQSEGLFSATVLAFNYGFLKGQRSIKNTMKKKSMEVSQ